MNSLYSLEQQKEQTRRQGILTKIWGRHKEVARLHCLGFKNKEIAEMLEITTATVVNNLKSPIVQQELARLYALRDDGAIDIAKDIDELLPIAIDTVRDVMVNAEKEETRLKSAIRVLDMGGHSPVKRILTAHGVFDKDDLMEIKRRAMENAPIGNAQDAEFKDEEKDKE